MGIRDREYMQPDYRARARGSKPSLADRIRFLLWRLFTRRTARRKD